MTPVRRDRERSLPSPAGHLALSLRHDGTHLHRKIRKLMRPKGQRFMCRELLDDVAVRVDLIHVNLVNDLPHRYSHIVSVPCYVLASLRATPRQRPPAYTSSVLPARLYTRTVVPVGWDAGAAVGAPSMVGI